ncbi:MAG: hypothetical protein H6608_05675 [Flavobacteriales bacterium]|nr:hypothetical protein [Bacteroidota bacterium]MCB9240596.1 hypothetical protein [Flavobacteriales bacterium]
MVEESTEITTTPTEVVYHTKGFVKGELVSNILITMLISMSLMMGLIMMGVHIYIVTAALIGSMFGILHVLSGRTRYTINEHGLERYVQPNFKRFKETTTLYTWNDIKSYKRGDDLNRSRQVFHYLNISVRKAPGRLRISDDKGDKSLFKTFADVFESYVDHPDKQDVTGVAPIPPSQKSLEDAAEDAMIQKGRQPEPTSSGNTRIKKEQTFYQTTFAKVMTIGLIFLCGFLINWGFQNGMREFNWFRLGVIVIPGTIYMIIRVFYRKG